ncbi:MAG: glycosyltransferase [Chloroflexota bacterium]
MVDVLQIAVVSCYLIVTCLLLLYGGNVIYLSAITWWQGHRLPADTEPTLVELPKVTVQLPIYNELYVAARLIEAAAALDYPSHLLEIQVLDDSTDETIEVVRETVARIKQQGLDIVHLHRDDRTGFKAGALQAGLQSAKGEFVAMFDADFIPTATFLKKTVPYFENDRVAFVQARWGHLNPDYSLLTLLQSLALDAHFMVEQFARSNNGYWFNFNGTAGVWRRTAMEDAGGWKADTLTEDLDLSYRVHLNGWEGRYLRGLVVPAELPVSISAFRRQQHRWAQGSLECAKKLVPDIWRAALPFKLKLQATLHLTTHCIHLLIFTLTISYPLLALSSADYGDWIVLFGFGYIFNITTLAPAFFFIIGQQQQGRSWQQIIPKILFFMALGSGLMLNTVRAAWQAFSRRQTPFERTAKFGITQQAQDWTHKQRYQLKLDPIVYFEIALGVYCLGTIWLAIYLGNWAIALYTALFGVGLWFVSILTIVQAVAVYRNHKVITEATAISDRVDQLIDHEPSELTQPATSASLAQGSLKNPITVKEQSSV